MSESISYVGRLFVEQALTFCYNIENCTLSDSPQNETDRLEEARGNGNAKRRRENDRAK